MGRDREHLTELEVQRLIKAARGNRHGHRDATMILIGFRHGLRVSELCGLQWASIEFETGTIHVRRAKGGGRRRIRSSAMNCGRSGSSSASHPRPSSSPRSGAAHSLLRALPSCSAVRATKPRLASRSIRTCSRMPAATRWPIKASIPEPCRAISAIAPSIRPHAMRRWPRVGSKTSGGGRRAAGATPLPVRAIGRRTASEASDGTSRFWQRCVHQYGEIALTLTALKL